MIRLFFILFLSFIALSSCESTAERNQRLYRELNQDRYEDDSDDYSDEEYRESEPSRRQCITCDGTGVVERQCRICRGTGDRDGSGNCESYTGVFTGCGGTGYQEVSCRSCDGSGWVY